MFFVLFCSFWAFSLKGYEYGSHPVPCCILKNSTIVLFAGVFIVFLIYESIFNTFIVLLISILFS